MGAMKDANVRDVLVEHLVAIANALCGEDESTTQDGDLMRHSLGRIAKYLSDNPSAGMLPAVSSADNGKILKVSSATWGVGEDGGLPAVTSADNGKVLKVSSASWSIGDDVSLPAVSSADNGKVLLVADGVWTVANLSTSS